MTLRWISALGAPEPSFQVRESRAMAVKQAVPGGNTVGSVKGSISRTGCWQPDSDEKVEEKYSY